MLPEMTEFVPAIRMGIVRKVLLGLENRAECIFSLLLNAFATEQVHVAIIVLLIYKFQKI
jgi:hypothetical protein